jgi:hypothetical protein
MVSHVYALAALLAATGAVADFASLLTAVSQIQSAVENTNTQVENWDGTLAGALTIQNSESAIQTAVTNAINAAQGLTITSSEVSQGVAAAQSLVNPIDSLLSNLSAQASKLTSLGANTIVANDLEQLTPQTYKLESAIYAASPCNAISDLETAFNSINSAFASANKAFSVSNAGTPPTAPASCGASSGAAAASSAAPAVTSAPVVPTNGTTNGTETTTLVQTATITSCPPGNSTVPTGVVPVESGAAAAGVKVGFGAAVLGAAALLL